jgi:hypothetical protein
MTITIHEAKWVATSHKERQLPAQLLDQSSTPARAVARRCPGRSTPATQFWLHYTNGALPGAARMAVLLLRAEPLPRVHVLTATQFQISYINGN